MLKIISAFFVFASLQARADLFVVSQVAGLTIDRVVLNVQGSTAIGFVPAKSAVIFDAAANTCTFLENEEKADSKIPCMLSVDGYVTVRIGSQAFLSYVKNNLVLYETYVDYTAEMETALNNLFNKLTVTYSAPNRAGETFYLQSPEPSRLPAGNRVIEVPTADPNVIYQIRQ
jgi:hypothetical protein